jgi:hypothetical protein
MNTTPNTQPLSQEVWQRPFVKAHQDWCDDFVVELRLIDVPGSVIGDHLGEVETHCAATGETPDEAFGEPAAYATQIAQATDTQPVSGVGRITVLSAAQVAALLVGTAAATTWARGEDLTYNLVQVGLLGLFVLVLLLLPKLMGPLMHHPWTVGIPLVCGTPLLALGSAFSAQLELPVALVLPAAPMAIGLFVVVLVLAWGEYRELSRDLDTDLVTSPLVPEPGTSETAAIHQHWITVLPAFLMPMTYLVLATFGWLFA